MVRTLQRSLGHCGRWLGSLVFPDVCSRCGRQASGQGLCALCRKEVLDLPLPVADVPAGMASLNVGVQLSEPVRELVHGLKYHGQKRNARFLVDLAMAQPHAFPGSAMLVPVPVHAARRRERGYNQAHLIAKEWSHHLGSPVLDCLERYRATGSQTRLGADARRANLEAALRVRKNFRKDVPLILVDDICTTGATFSACAAVLLHAGAHEVHGLACAWAPGR